MSATCSVLPFADEAGRCDACGKELSRRQSRWCSSKCADTGYNNHRWTTARHAARLRDGRKCTRDGCELRHSLEVNHIEPRNGQGYDWGCWNHLDNLETLCHWHHLEVTRQQAADRAALFARMEQKRRDDCSGQTLLDFGEASA